jgi:SH3-like domain-containing protein
MCVGALPVVSAMAAIRTVAPTSSNAAVTGSAVVAEAEKFLGYPYAYTGDSPATGFSCIGFVWYVYHELGMNIPGTNAAAYQAYPQVSESNLEPGDLVFFQGTFAGLFPSHVAIYIGGGKIIHAANPSYGVTISSIQNDPRDGNYWQQHYLSAERPWSGPSTSGPGSGGVPRRHHVLVVVVPSLNLRSGPSMAYSVLTVLVRGTRVTVEGWRPAWVRVATAGGTVGWVLRAGVAREGGYRPRLGRHHSQSAAARHAIWASAKTVYVAGLRVHSAPSLSAPVIFNLVRGNRVGIESRLPGWDKIVTARGDVGWVLSQYLGHHYGTIRSRSRGYVHVFRNAMQAGVNVHVLPSPQAAVITVTDGRPVRILHWAPGWAKVRLSTGQVGWVSREFLGGSPAASSRPHVHRRHYHPFAGGRAVIAGVRIHSGPSLYDAVVAATTPGMRIRILGYDAGFAHVETSTGIFGWIAQQFVGGSAARQVRAVRRVRHFHRFVGGNGPYATATVRVHASPGLSAAVVGLAYAGERLMILRSGLWDYVRLANRQVGYVYSAYVAG